MTNSIFDCISNQKNIFSKNQDRLNEYLRTIYSDSNSISQEFNIKYLFIVNHEFEFSQSVSYVTKHNSWGIIEKFDIDLSDRSSFGSNSFEAEISNHPVCDLFSVERNTVLNRLMTLWFLETANNLNLKTTDTPIIYSEDSHFEELWNLSNWKGPAEIDNIEWIL